MRSVVYLGVGLSCAGCGSPKTVDCRADEPELPLLYINEFLAYSNDPEVEPDWIELYNGGDSKLSLVDMVLWADDGGEADAQFPWTFPDNASIAAGGFVTVACDTSDRDYGDYLASFRIGRRDGVIELYYAGCSSLIAIDQVEYVNVPTAESYARTEDGGSLWEYSGTPSPGESNE